MGGISEESNLTGISLVSPFVFLIIAFCHSNFTISLSKLFFDMKKKKNLHFSKPSFILSIMPSPGLIDHES